MSTITKPSRVLLVEDDPIHSRVLHEWLTQAGFAVERVSTYQHALAALKTNWDAVIADCELPDGNGMQLGKLAKLAMPLLPYIVITSDTSAQTVVAALRNGVDDIMLKHAPLRRELLVERVRELIAQRQDYAATIETVMAIGAHPDDIEIGCGGTLLAHIEQGRRVVLLTLSAGAKGGDTNIRKQESAKAAQAMGAELMFGDLEDTKIPENGATIEFISSVVSQLNPAYVYTHSANDVHQDHRNVARASVSATRHVKRVYCYQAPSATVDFRPSMFVNITRTLNKKLELISMFESQTARAAYLDPDQIRANARYWSRFTEGTGGEPFEVIRTCA